MWFPHPDAEVVRGRLVQALGADRVSPLQETPDGLVVVICRDCARRDDEPLVTPPPPIPDAAAPGGPCVDASHRVLDITFPHPEAEMIRGRLIRALGADHVSGLGKTETGWALVICRRCVRRRRDEGLAA